jgi:prepilin signal peptidase PulO-like enzyme (type II secretory pathway)
MEPFFLVASCILGLIIGSFLNCAAWRLYEGESMNGRSHCRSCQKLIYWYDNIPILSFLLLRGHCRHCASPISWQYPLVEAITALLFMLAYWLNPFDWLLLARNWFLLAVFVLIFVMDARWYVIVDKVTLPAAITVLGANLWLGIGWSGLLISATIGTGFFLIQYLVSRGRWIGGGDIRLGLLLGVGLGWPNILAAIFIAYGFGAVFGIAALLSGKKKWGSMVPLGTFLSVAGAITLLYGEKIVHWYLNFVNLQ